jgi:hypothetical protein
MKNLLTLVLLHCITFIALAQVPQKFTYQSVIRNAGNQLVANQSVGIKISILQGNATGSAVYAETHSPLTNANGLVTLEIGGGTLLSGDFANINWANGPYFVKTETDVNGGSNYTITNTTQLLSVPYAMYAKSAGSVAGGSGITITSVSSAGDTLYLSNGQTFVAGGNNGGTGSLVLPTITTNAVTGITSNSATFGGAISNANGNQIMERGIVYSTSPNPIIGTNKIVIGNGIGAFDTISDLGYQYAHLLNSNTTYYVRAYAITENNISAYGNEVSFTTLSVGQNGPGGGIVFFNKGNTNGGWQYLESATSDQSTSTQWGCFGTSIPGTQRIVGSGEANTNLIVAGCSDASFASKLCDNLILGGQSDWFLPSRDELNLMYKNMHLNSQGNFNTSTSYWSSSEYDYASAWNFPFYVGVANYDGNAKSNSYYVRAVRAF